MKCTRCGNEITETRTTHYDYCGESRFRYRLEYAKISLKTPEMTSCERPQSIYLCNKCYSDFCNFLEDTADWKDAGIIWNEED